MTVPDAAVVASTDPICTAVDNAPGVNAAPAVNDNMSTVAHMSAVGHMSAVATMPAAVTAAMSAAMSAAMAATVTAMATAVSAAMTTAMTAPRLCRHIRRGHQQTRNAYGGETIHSEQSADRQQACHEFSPSVFIIPGHFITSFDIATFSRLKVPNAWAHKPPRRALISHQTPAGRYSILASPPSSCAKPRSINREPNPLRRGTLTAGPSASSHSSCNSRPFD